MTNESLNLPEAGNYTSIIPATDWFYVHKQLTTQADAPPVVYHVAAFALTNGGEVVGLIPVAEGRKNPPRLVRPPAGVDGLSPPRPAQRARGRACTHYALTPRRRCHA